VSFYQHLLRQVAKCIEPNHRLSSITPKHPFEYSTNHFVPYALLKIVQRSGGIIDAALVILF